MSELSDQQSRPLKPRPQMDPVGLGDAIRDAREELGLSVRALARQIGVHHSYIARLEGADYRTIRPSMLSRLSRALEINERDLFALAGMDAPEGLPSFAPYLRAKYKITAPALKAMEDYWSFVSEKYRVEPRPEPGHGAETAKTTSPAEPTKASNPTERTGPLTPGATESTLAAPTNESAASTETTGSGPIDEMVITDVTLSPSMEAVLGIDHLADRGRLAGPSHRRRGVAQTPLRATIGEE